MLRHFPAVILMSFFATQALAEGPVPDRRQVITSDVDFYGSDLQPLFDTSREACEAACLGNLSCMAYTFNTRSSACFPKSAVTERRPFDGAISAEILATEPSVLTHADARRAELDFLGDSDIARATGLARDISRRHPGGQYTAEALLEAATARTRAQDWLNAMRWTGALAALSDESGHWAEYARLSAAIRSETGAEQRRLKAQALEASVNAYLRAATAPERVNALLVMAPALEDAGRGRDMLHALRLAESIQPRADVMAALEQAVPKYGFRVTDHRAENETEAPRICAEFSEPLIKAGQDYAPFVRVPDAGMAVEARDSQICVDGARHGARYTITFRAGLPAASGETLIRDTEITLYVRDRAPKVSFAGRAYVLPKAADAALPIETVNLDTVDLVLRRVSDRNLMRTLQTGYFGRPLSQYQLDDFSNEIAEEVWRSAGDVANELNQTMTTRLPLGDVLADQEPGLYALTARIEGLSVYEDPGATQWFVLSDLGLTTLKGTDGLHVFVRGLGDAAALEGVKLTLLSRANRELASAETDAEGHALFAPGLVRGTGASAPALVLAEAGDADMTFLSLTDPAFDLSDRGVEGREAAPPVDVFLSTDRGAYRAGEVIHAAALARDSLAQAISGLPLTVILTRPDGVEYSRHLSTKDAAGGHVFALPIGATAPRGSWRLAIKADLDAPPLASTQVLVEDFLPERIDFQMSLPDGPIRPGDTVPVSVEARYLFGAPGAGLQVSGTAKLEPLRRLEGFPGYVFGRHDEYVSSPTAYADGGRTDANGQLLLPVALPEAEQQDRPYEAQITLSVREGSGRPVERQITHALAPAGDMIGIRPDFDGTLPEGAQARFDVIGINTELAPTLMNIRWSVNRVETRYQWYQQYGNWYWEPVTSRTRIATGTAELTGDPLSITAPVDWGNYELEVERFDGAYVAASTSFQAGWYAPADASRTPDTLELSLDREDYRSGDTAYLRIVPRHAGTALVTVMSNRVIDMQAVEVTEGENLIPLAVTEAWGAGAYVSAQVIRPMDVAAGQSPARALGLAYARIDPRTRQLSVEIAAPDLTAPRAALDTVVSVDGLEEGETGYVTLAAVDVGILNLTGFESPDPSAHYFGQRRLGVEIRDLYGRLIDGMTGAQGQVRSGGDLGSSRDRQSPPPTEELVAFFSGPVELAPDGTAEARFDLPDFNGTVRLMAIAWSPRAVGQAARDVVVRDPVVVTATLPRFLAPGDSSELLLEIIHAEGPAGRMGLDVSATGLTLSEAAPSGFDLAEGETRIIRLPVTAGDIGDHALRVALTTPDGQQLTKSLTLGVRANDPPTSQTRRLTLAPGEALTLDDNIFAGLQDGTAFVSAGPLSKLDAPGLLSALDRYPYGCTEQVTSQALPLLYHGPVAQALGLGSAERVTQRIDEAIEQVLTRQASNGSFGLWQAGSGDFWLDAYVSDFLSRARDKGHAVPDQAFAMAMDNLRNRVNYAPDFDEGGEDIAYALLVLAREGAARMGDLRYYADVKAEAFATPLAAAQLGAALAAYGDQSRADRMFAQAMRVIDAPPTADEPPLWRVDYGTRYRDRAGVLALAAEAGSAVVNTASLADTLTVPGPHMSPQEQSAALMAVAALMADEGARTLTLDGATVSGPFVHRFDQQGLRSHEITNTSGAPLDITVTTQGIPQAPEAAGGYGYSLSRSYYDMEGAPVDIATISTGTRLVAVLRITPFEGGEARLMIDDPLPAGLEIDNPNLLRSGDIRALDWLNTAQAEYSEARSDRFLAAVDWRSDQSFDLAYIVRAVAPGRYHHPAALVEDMYRPAYRAWTDTGQMQVTPQ